MFLGRRRSPASPGGSRRRPGARGPVWVVVADPLTARVFFDCGIVDRLAERLDGRLTFAFSFPRAASEEWAARVPDGVRVLREDDLYPVDVAPSERVRRRIDRWLDERVGYYPLAIRLNLRHGFHRERMHPGHRNHLLDSDRVGPLPVRPRIDLAMRRWHFSPRRYVASALRRRLEAERPAVVLSNLQMQSATPFIGLARRLGLTTIGYVASWDHTVGKGVIWNELDGYVVQNEAMADDLVRYHDVPRELVAVTGWPQADVYHERRPRAAFDALAPRLRARPCAAGPCGDGEHADEHALRGSVLRATRRVVGELGRESAVLAPLPPAPARPRVA